MQGHRWVEDEPRIPFEIEILYEDERIIVIDKPHFLATTPRGMWYRETALMRLRERFRQPQLTPAHRLDRMTAGVIVFVRIPKCRAAYQMLFQTHAVTKIYECLAPAKPIMTPRFGTATRLDPPAVFPLLRRSRIVKDRGRLQAYEEPGSVNAQTLIELGDPGAGAGDVAANLASRRLRRYVLHPRTGKTHQLRVHMNSIGLPISGDDFYPQITERRYDDFTRPLQLIARSLHFIDPVSREPCHFNSRFELDSSI